MTSSELLSEMRNTDIRTVNRDTLTDIRDVKINPSFTAEEKAVEYLKEDQVTKKQAVRFSNGGQLGFERLKGINLTENELVRVKCEKLFLGIGRADIAKDQLDVKCVINYPGDGI